MNAASYQVSLLRIQCVISSKSMHLVISKSRSSPPEVFYKKTVNKDIAKFTGKHLCQNETVVQVFSCEFCDIFKNTFFIEHLRTTASEKRRILEPFSC